MICPKCGSKQGDERFERIRCGVIFAKLTPEDFMGNTWLDRQDLYFYTRPVKKTFLIDEGLLLRDTSH